VKRALFVVAAALAAIFLFLLASASANTSLFARHYPLLVVINATVVLGLLGLVGWQMRQLHHEYKARLFGSRLKLRLVLMFGALAVLPGILVYAMSMQFVTRSIETWFNVRVENALSSGLALGRTALDSLIVDLKAKGESMSLDLADRGDVSYRAALSRLREQYGVSSAMLLTRSGQLVTTASGDLAALHVPMPDPAQLKQVRVSKPFSVIESDAEGGMLLRVMVSVTPRDLAEETKVLQLVQPAPASLVQDAEAVQAVYRDYEQLKLARSGLTQIYAATLTLTVLLSVSAAFALAFFFARRLSAPLSVLAEGTQAVAQGDFSPRQAVYSSDELGVLTQSFNRMTRQLDEARRDAEHHRGDLEASRAYLESILANLSAGVMVFDSHFMLRHYNQGACNILADDLVGLPGAPVDAWPRQSAFGHAVRDGFANSADDWQSQLELAREKGEMSGMPQFLLLRGSRLPEAAGGGGYVLIFDDVTRMVAAQRSAAWGEVARRLAHEIKNPLTPIQLSAERLQHKLADKLDPAGAETLRKSVGTIVGQVQAMKRLVNDFRDYARLPLPELAALDINALISELLGLYENSSVRMLPQLGRNLPAVAGDATQLRQVVHNLLRNAEDALAETSDPQLQIHTDLFNGRLRLAVTDNGPGFPPEIMGRAFEPYVTTKQRGSGLGLAIVRKIIDEHQGTIALGNVEPHGARIVIDLPLAGTAQPAVA
jgi:nitrogen fixation/metabolism regulation signal transduction histidine kinase